MNFHIGLTQTGNRYFILCSVKYVYETTDGRIFNGICALKSFTLQSLKMKDRAEVED